MTLSIKLFSIFLLCFITEWLYFRIAERFDIVDRPNHRTLHEEHTIRGGGIIFPVSVLLFVVFFGVEDWRFLAGLLLVSVISFIDDLGHVKSFIRFLGQAIAISLLLWQMQWVDLGWGWAILALIISAGVLNAYNFMDGINGITGGYSLVAVLFLFYINNFQVEFTSNGLLGTLLTALLVFNFFNFRKKAVCFAGDVGSVSIAFVIVFFILKLIVLTSNPVFIMLLAIYGVDSVLTIIHRLTKKENIFEAHRSHLFQVMVSHGQNPHLRISTLYMIAQLLVNSLILFSLGQSIPFQVFLSLAILLVLAVVYVATKRYFLAAKKE